MDFRCGSGGDDKGQVSQGSEGLKRKWSNLEDTMRAMKDALLKENAEKSAKIRRLMQDNIRLEETLMRVENSALQPELMTRPNPLVAFPVEVWEMIIKNLDYSSDLQMLCLAFPQLVPLVKKTKKTIYMFENVLPLVCKHLKLRDIINCRRVCGKWNQDVCTLLANWNAPNLAPGNIEATSEASIPDCQPPYQLKSAYNFSNRKQIQTFMNKMADHPGNPFLGRYLCLTVERQPIYWESVLELVKKWGENIWNLEMVCYRGRQNQINFYKALQETLIHLPNLKYLTIECNFPANGPSKRTMAVQIMSSPLPPLPYLQSLKLDFNSEAGMISAFSPFFTQQIRRLELRNGSLGNENLKEETFRGLINLEHLEVESKIIQDISRLLKFSSPNLKKLRLINSNFTPVSVSITSELFGELLDKFSRLEYLDLAHPHIGINVSLDSTRRFSKLKTLKITVGVDEDDLQHNLDFLLWFSSLKHLIIRSGYGYKTLNVNEMDQHSTLKVRNYVYTNTILDSNLWTLIPSLELLDLQGGRNGQGIYTREMYENRVVG